MSEDDHGTIYHAIRDFFSAFDGARQLRKIIPEAQRDDPHGEEWQLWSVWARFKTGETSDRMAVVVIYAGTHGFGDNGFDVFVQPSAMDNIKIRQEAMRDVMALDHWPVGIGNAVGRSTNH